VEDDRLAREPRHDVRGESCVGGQELLDEAVVVRRATEDEELEVGERVAELRMHLSVHTRRIGRREVDL
jgi:hypothetical protein